MEIASKPGLPFIPNEVKEEVVRVFGPFCSKPDVTVCMMTALTAILDLSPIELKLVRTLARAEKDEKGVGNEGRTDKKRVDAFGKKNPDRKDGRAKVVQTPIQNVPTSSGAFGSGVSSTTIDYEIGCDSTGDLWITYNK